MDNEHMLIDWSRGWLAAQLAKGRSFADIRAEFNAASPLLVSLYNAVTATDQDETPAIVDAITRAFARAARNSD